MALNTGNKTRSDITFLVTIERMQFRINFTTMLNFYFRSSQIVTWEPAIVPEPVTSRSWKSRLFLRQRSGPGTWNSFWWEYFDWSWFRESVWIIMYCRCYWWDILLTSELLINWLLTPWGRLGRRWPTRIDLWIDPISPRRRHFSAGLRATHTLRHAYIDFLTYSGDHPCR